jgi:hypothetical protein
MGVGVVMRFAGSPRKPVPTWRRRPLRLLLGMCFHKRSNEILNLSTENEFHSEAS